MKKRRIGIEEVMLCFMMSFLIVLMFIQVVFRYFLGRSITWSEEVSRLLFIWTVFLGIDLAAKYNRHIRVTFQLKLFTEPVQRGITIFAYFVWLAFSLTISIVAIEFVITMFKFPYFSQTLHVKPGLCLPDRSPGLQPGYAAGHQAVYRADFGESRSPGNRSGSRTVKS
jgi:TRAP-type C4-dicarboxylate transport system permease small subunit